MVQLTIYSTRTCKVGTEEYANYSEDRSVMALEKNQKPFALNYTLISLSEEAYQYSTPLPDASQIWRQPAVCSRVTPIHIISALICAWGMKLRC